MPGPNPKPTRIRVLEGNAGHKRLNRAEPWPQRSVPTRPGWLLPEARREWLRIVPELDRLGMLTRVDRAALAGYCQWWARWRQAEETLVREGLTFVTGNGYTQQRPEVAIAQKAAMLLRGYLGEFGLTPAARSRLAVPESRPESLDEVLG